MQLKRFVLPHRKKAIVFVLFILITIGGLIQRAPLIESPPSPMPSPLGDFSFTLLSILLSFPYLVLVFLIGVVGIVPLHRFLGLIIVRNVIYLYFLSCSLVSAFDCYRHKFSRWHWMTVVGVPFLLIGLYLIHLHLPPIFIDDLLNYLGIALIISVYLYLLFCLGFLIQDVVTKKRASAA